MEGYVVALDQGTTSSRARVFDAQSRVVGSAGYEFEQHFPQPGWVEHDPEQIWSSQRRALEAALAAAQVSWRQVRALGITNQRETAIVWDRRSGAPIYNAIVWQSRQTLPLCDRLREQGHEELLRSRTGLVLDAYFSATKIQWILDRIPGARERGRAGELVCGTVDSWLLYKLTGGRVHATDASNASRTLLYDIERRIWDDELLELFDVPRRMLPEVRDSSGLFGEVDPALCGGARVPITGVAGDQQAALFGQACFAPGATKNTYGTGCFVLMNTGRKPQRSSSGLLTSVAWQIAGEAEYVLEGSVFVAGAAVQWLRDQLGIIQNASETEALALSVPDTGGVYFVPAFTGLGAPHWDPRARGTILGLTRGSSRAHLARAALEAIAFCTRDVLECFAADTGLAPRSLQVDGGAAANGFLMQFQADVLGIPVRRPRVLETTALGAAYLAGLAIGYWEGKEAIAAHWQEEHRFEPRIGQTERDRQYAVWRSAVERSLNWARE
jgi:glycerol kinase